MYKRQPYVPQAVVSPRKAFFADAKIISLDNAVDKICAETISCYPPGIPVICPGEKFTKDIVQYLQAVKFMGVHFQGCLDHQLDTVQIIAQ